MPHNPQLPHASLSTQNTFTRIPDAVLLDARLTPVQFRIYAVIARRADRETASAFPSYATIARDANISRTSAINGVTALVSFGYLTKRPQESGQGDATSNLYTISGEGSQLFAPPLHGMMHDTHHGGADFVPPVVQQIDHGGANAVPEPDSKNQKQKNKTQENRVAPAREISAAAADPEHQRAQADFQENIGALTGIARQTIDDLVAEFGARRVIDAIREAVIYEKRSLGYVRRVLSAWQRNGRHNRDEAKSKYPGLPGSCDGSKLPNAADLVWPPPELAGEMPAMQSAHPAVAAWDAIRQQLPQLGRLMRMATPETLVGNALTVSTDSPRIYSALTGTQHMSVMDAARRALGDDATLHVTLIEQPTAQGQPLEWGAAGASPGSAPAFVSA